MPREKVLVIGAGLAGTFTALQLAKEGYEVVLVEERDQIIPPGSSSNEECYKLHTGLHYAGDLKTALQCLEESIIFARAIPAECLAGGKDLDSPCRRGRHYVMSNSLFPPEQIKQVALALQKKYTQLVSEDIKNQVFGDPQNFIKFLKESDYPEVSKEISFLTSDRLKVSKIKVVQGIETGESQIDIELLRKYLTLQITSHPGIHFLPNTKLMNLAVLPDQLGYSAAIRTKNNKHEFFAASAVVNCTWQNIEFLDKQLGFYIPDENRVVRIKVCARVELPPEMHGINTCIFSIGPYCSITNLGNGEAVLASEMTTNIGYYKAGSRMPTHLAELTKKLTDLTLEKSKLYGEKIIKECSNYIPGLKKAKLKKVMVGYVKLMKIEKAYSPDALYDRNSAIHQRMEGGVEVRDLCYIANSANKMSYSYKNSADAMIILKHHFLIQSSLNQVLNSVKEPLADALEKMGGGYKKLAPSLLYHLCKKVLLSDAEFHRSENKQEYAHLIVSSMMQILIDKKAVLSSIKNGLFALKKTDLKQRTEQLETITFLPSKL